MNLNDLKQVLKVENGKELLIGQLQKAKTIYNSIATEAYNTKSYTEMNFASSHLTKAFMTFVERNDLSDYSKSLFECKGGYNAVISQKNEDGSYSKVLQVKIKSQANANKLAEEYDFIVRG